MKIRPRGGTLPLSSLVSSLFRDLPHYYCDLVLWLPLDSQIRRLAIITNITESLGQSRRKQMEEDVLKSVGLISWRLARGMKSIQYLEPFGEG